MTAKNPSKQTSSPSRREFLQASAAGAAIAGGLSLARSRPCRRDRRHQDRHDRLRRALQRRRGPGPGAGEGREAGRDGGRLSRTACESRRAFFQDELPRPVRRHRRHLHLRPGRLQGRDRSQRRGADRLRLEVPFLSTPRRRSRPANTCSSRSRTPSTRPAAGG